MMQMLAAGGLPPFTDETRAADSDNREGYFELEAVKRTERDASWVAESSGKAVKVICPLLQFLPDSYDYRVLFMDRALSEVIASQQEMLQNRGTAGATVSSDQLAAIFHKEVQHIKTWLAAQGNFELLEIEHRQVIGDPQVAAQRVQQFLAIPLDVEAMAARVNPQLYRQRR